MHGGRLHAAEWEVEAVSKLVLFLYPWELASMDEYSSSLPSATTIGKVWKRRDFRNPRGRWIVGMYAFNVEPETARDRRLHPNGWTRILWFDVVLREGPEPPGYRAPDWSNYAAWKTERDVERVREASAAE